MDNDGSFPSYSYAHCPEMQKAADVIFGPFFGANFLWQNMHLCYLNRFLQLCYEHVDIMDHTAGSHKNPNVVVAF